MESQLIHKIIHILKNLWINYPHDLDKYRQIYSVRQKRSHPKMTPAKFPLINLVYHKACIFQCLDNLLDMLVAVGFHSNLQHNLLEAVSYLGLVVL